ncbi:MAG: hypothetical protein JWQ72_2705 [Polaromonas sp.]|nr:hypothetical protein [Polaromonas sp.]
MCATVIAAPSPATLQTVETLAGQIAAELRAACPLTDPASQAAFDRCRQALFGPSQLRKNLLPVLLWGRQAKDAATPLKETNLTQFAPDVWTGLYAPVFMFDGSYQVSWVERENLYLVKLGAAFRNRLAPGQFPYPFWHDAAKWGAYENANALLLWIAPEEKKIRVAQFSWQEGPLAGVSVNPARHEKFSGQWLWTDSQGRTQPAVTLFDGLFSAGNPYKAPLEKDYRALAVSLRDGQCFSCHVPDNPDKMKRLVLLQTPAHAAGEISRILQSVRDDRMPRDEAGVERPLDPVLKKNLLELGAVFEKTVQSARQWETNSTTSSR